MADEEVKKILSKYKERIGEHTDDASQVTNTEFSKDYEEFRREALSSSESKYEKWCTFAESILKFKPNQKELPEIEKAIATAHLNVTPTGASSFAAMVAFLFVLLGLGYLFVTAAVSSNFFPMPLFLHFSFT